jgi:hypothetical protein
MIVFHLSFDTAKLVVVIFRFSVLCVAQHERDGTVAWAIAFDSWLLTLKGGQSE